MSDAYKGESPAKKVARALFWSAVRLALGERFHDGRFLVLASREGGDISVLQGLGVEPSRIVPVEINPEAAAACQRKWPDHRVIVGDAFAVAERMGSELAVCFLDGCGPLDGKWCEGLARIARRMRSGSLLATAGMRGRERNVVLKRYAEQARARTTIARQRGKELGLPGSDGTMDFSRARAVQEHLIHRLTGARIAPVCVVMFNYQSSTGESNGVPMTMCGFQLRKLYGTSLEGFRREGAALEKAACDEACREGYVAEVKADDETLRKHAVAMNLDVKTTGLIFNVPAGRVAAWRAHATRGTYAP